MIYLLDTNVVAELTTRPRPSSSVVAWARSVPAPSLHLSVVTLAEIELGVAAVEDTDRRMRFERALAGIKHEYRDRITAIGDREALAYLALHKRLKDAGTPIDPPDALIAATALARGWTLVTRNAKHFSRTEVIMINPWEDRP